MGYNRSGKRRVQKQKRLKREVARIVRKQAAAEQTQTPAATGGTKS